MWFSLLYFALKMEKGDADRQRDEAKWQILHSIKLAMLSVVCITLSFGEGRVRRLFAFHVSSKGGDVRRYLLKLTPLLLPILPLRKLTTIHLNSQPFFRWLETMLRVNFLFKV